MYKRLFILFLILPLQGWSQNVTFTAEVDKTEVSVNEQFIVHFSLVYGQENVTIDRPIELPNFGRLHVLGTSKVNSFEFRNGNATNKSGIEVALLADEKGEYEIPSSSVSVNGKTYKTKPLKIKVTDHPKIKKEQSKRLQGAFLKTEVSNENPYINQSVILSVKIYSRDYSILRRLRDFQKPDLNHFSAKMVEDIIENNERQVLIDGKTFVEKELIRYILFPQNPGLQTIDPFSIGSIISGYYGAEAVELSSDPIELNVKNLPPGKPKNFSGAVGDFNMNVQTPKSTVKSNETAEFELEIIGSGNLNTLITPDIDVPKEIELYPPKSRDAFEIRPTGLKGKIVKNYIMVPQYGGEYHFEPINFSYFDPDKGKYITLKSNSFDLTVEGPQRPKTKEIPPENTEEPVKDSQFTKNHDIERDSNTFGEEKATPGEIKIIEKIEKIDKKLWGGIAFAAAALSVLAFFLLRRKNQDEKPKKEQDEKEFKTEISNGLKELKELQGKNNKMAFLSLQEDILTKIGMFLTHTSFTDFTDHGVGQALIEKYGETGRQWGKLLARCKQAKYAFSGQELDLKQSYSEMNNLWKAFKKSALK